jgi:Family of unknown function (DUF6491)
MAKTRILGVLALAYTVGVLPSHADEPSSSAPPPAQEKQASIAFADKNIWNWQVLDNQTVLIETNGRKWYKAKLLSACIDLPFKEKLGFESNPGGSFDKFSSIKTGNQTCPLISLTETTPPPKKGKKAPTAPPKPAS